jgi:UrcA family protein
LISPRSCPAGRLGDLLSVAVRLGPIRQETTMLRLIAIASLIGWTGFAHADPHLAYTHHALKVDIHDLDLTRDADLRILKARIARASDQICGGRPDRGNRYSQAELKLLVPAYDQCRTAAIQHAATTMKLPVQVLAGNDREEETLLK